MNKLKVIDYAMILALIAGILLSVELIVKAITGGYLYMG
jgi:predicted membrane channel-forming protein YqfA (hemolysin III family)